MIHTVKGFGIINKAEVDIFLKLSCFLDDPWMFPIWFLVPLPFLKPAWKFTVHVLLKSGLENFEHYFTSVWGECDCVVVWAFFGIAFLWDWNENWPFPVDSPGIKITWRNINNLRNADDTALMAENEEELKSLLMKEKEESENVGLKFNIQN